MKVRVTARKYGGDDAASWCIFLDGYVVITGLYKSEVPYWKARIAKEAGLSAGQRADESVR